MKYNLSEILCLKGANLYSSVSTSDSEAACQMNPKYCAFLTLVNYLRKKNEFFLSFLHWKYYKVVTRGDEACKSQSVGKKV